MLVFLNDCLRLNLDLIEGLLLGVGCKFLHAIELVCKHRKSCEYDLLYPLEVRLDSLQDVITVTDCTINQLGEYLLKLLIRSLDKMLFRLGYALNRLLFHRFSRVLSLFI